MNEIADRLSAASDAAGKAVYHPPFAVRQSGP